MKFKCTLTHPELHPLLWWLVYELTHTHSLWHWCLWVSRCGIVGKLSVCCGTAGEGSRRRVAGRRCPLIGCAPVRRGAQGWRSRGRRRRGVSSASDWRSWWAWLAWRREAGTPDCWCGCRAPFSSRWPAAARSDGSAGWSRCRRCSCARVCSPLLRSAAHPAVRIEVRTARRRKGVWMPRIWSW